MVKARLVISLLITWKALPGQPVVAPTPENVGAAKGQTIGGYNVVNSFELGYRFRTAAGNTGKYRSDVNFGNGLRLLGSSLGVNSTDGHGHFFDHVTLRTQGLGNDPYEFASLRVEKNRLYRYNMLWRLHDYFNPGLTIAGGGHFMNTQRRLQDHEVMLFPQSPLRLMAGYTRNVQDGPALTTANFFGSPGDEFPLFSNVKRERNEYRLGGEARLFGMRFNVLRGWDNFKEDALSSLPAPDAGRDLGDPVALSNLQRAEPYHGNTPYWRVSLLTEDNRYFAVNGRFAYSMGRRNYVFDESAALTSPLGGAQNRQTLVFGSGRRPVATGSVTLSVFPTSRLAISNHTAVNNVRMEGDSSLREFVNSSGSGELVFFNFLGLRTIVNTTDVSYGAATWLGLNGGYHYSARRVRSLERIGFEGGESRLPAEQENRIDAGMVGVRVQPIKPLTISLEGEKGTADRPFFPIAERDYHAFSMRARYRVKSLSLSAAARTNYNTNSVSLSSHSSRSRNYFFDASWAGREWFALDASYSKLHLATASGLLYFASSEIIRGDRSIYVSSIHAGSLTARLAIGKRADLFAGYSHVQDVGDGRRSAPAGTGAGQPAFLAAQTFPLTFHSPMGRLSIRLHEKLRWNFGYQYYGYREEFSTRQNYRAHTGYTSVLWSF